jgi:hypothetical protein
MERLKQKVASSRVFASLQQAAGSSGGAQQQAASTSQQEQPPASLNRAPEMMAPACEQEAAQPGLPKCPIVPEAAMSTAWLMAADATAHLTDEEKGILLEVFKKEEQFQRDTIK